METVEVETLAVDFLELIVAVDGTVDVAGSFDRDRERPVFEIHFFGGIADHSAAVFSTTTSVAWPTWIASRAIMANSLPAMRPRALRAEV